MTSNGHDRNALAEAREVEWEDMICLSCELVFLGEVFEGEASPCPDCQSDDVARAT